MGERYLLAVPSHTALRDLDTEPPEDSGRGRRARRPWSNVALWSQALGDEAWQRLDVRDGRKGPLVVAAVKRRGVSRSHRRQQGDADTLVVIRYRDRDQHEVVQVDYSLSNAAPATPLGACARVAKAEHRIAACLPSSKSETGLADYEVRNWIGWQQHQTLALLATWFVVRATARGKKMDPCAHLPADSPGHRHDLARGVSGWHDAAYAQGVPEAMTAQ